MIRIADIRIDGGTQPRAVLNNAAVLEYAEAIKAGSQFPPVVVYFDGRNHWLADGFHRYHACRAAALIEIDAEIRTGTQRDAILHSVGANDSHGLRRTNEDKRQAVLVLLKDEEWGKWSDREVARQCTVSAPFVASVRASHLQILADSSDNRNARNVERGGKTFQQKVKKAGKPSWLPPRGQWSMAITPDGAILLGESSAHPGYFDAVLIDHLHETLDWMRRPIRGDAVELILQRDLARLDWRYKDGSMYEVLGAPPFENLVRGMEYCKDDRSASARSAIQ